jgi:DNA end-binding protein Ku
MRYPTDLREPADLSLPTGNDVTERELETALKFVRQETKPFIAEDLHDTYTEELEHMIKAKAKGKKPSKAPTKTPAKTKSEDLFEALKASLKQ